MDPLAKLAGALPPGEQTMLNALDRARVAWARATLGRISNWIGERQLA